MEYTRVDLRTNNVRNVRVSDWDNISTTDPSTEHWNRWTAEKESMLRKTRIARWKGKVSHKEGFPSTVPEKEGAKETETVLVQTLTAMKSR